MKRCSQCRGWKPLDAYFASRTKKDGKQSYCKDCKRQGERDQHSPASNRRHLLRNRYNISPEQYEEMLVAQDGRCALCRSSTPGRRDSYLSIDHDHACCPGAKSCGDCVRGLLCNDCNLFLGRYGEDHERISSIAQDLPAFLRADLLSLRRDRVLDTAPDVNVTVRR